MIEFLALPSTDPISAVGQPSAHIFVRVAFSSSVHINLFHGVLSTLRSGVPILGCDFAASQKGNLLERLDPWYPGILPPSANRTRRYTHHCSKFDGGDFMFGEKSI